MKKIYLVLGIIASTVSLYAQDYIIAPNDTVVVELTSATYTSNDINLDHDNLTTDSL